MQFVRVLGVALALSLSGCASFTQDEVAPVTLPSMSSYANKPDVYVDFNFYQGDPAGSATELPQVRDALKPELKRTLSNSALFGRVGFDAFDKQPGDLRLRLKVYNHAPGGGQVALGALSGLTLGLIPAMATDQYTMTLETLDAQDQPMSKASNHDSIHTWIGIWFLPAMGHTVQAAFNDTFDRQVNALLKGWADSHRAQYAGMSGRESKP
ncbi:hypothetical protein [Pseudomonas sp. KNUC1026]|uniref:hypothetical protein n=1 Tax=Pseudomonas sp. KNUC1026 TaxID=2893890 RepID=UPI001F3A08FE|nr:hypothetical protein [Pseudomonas sp. KNUC1026]UFH50266.1 hypothetical protein LN139_02870 [Pseudomonas sp. KNUC1026]